MSWRVLFWQPKPQYITVTAWAELYGRLSDICARISRLEEESRLQNKAERLAEKITSAEQELGMLVVAKTKKAMRKRP